MNYSKIKWSRNIKRDLRREVYIQLDKSFLRQALYRPFTKQYLYHSNVLIDELGITKSFFPSTQSETENIVLCVTGAAAGKPFHCLMTNCIPDFHLTSDTQCFPLYTYDEDGTNRHDNITDWALAQFRAPYGEQVTKQDIFHYVYAVLHHPTYRTRYAENLKRELPRIPLVADLTGFENLSGLGARLADLHLNYERAPEYKLNWIENRDMPFSWRVHKMKLSADKTSIVVNDSLTLVGIPPETFEYRLGNRSALDWIIDQYQISTDKKSGITSDPYRTDDPEYIVRLIGRVVSVSVETVKAVREIEKNVL